MVQSYNVTVQTPWAIDVHQSPMASSIPPRAPRSTSPTSWTGLEVV